MNDKVSTDISPISTGVQPGSSATTLSPVSNGGGCDSPNFTESNVDDEKKGPDENSQNSDVDSITDQTKAEAVSKNEAEYQRTLDGLERIRSIVGTHLELPQICVVGNQNQGKSSLLEAITGLKFPEGDGTVTRAPAVVSCRRDYTNLAENVYEVAGKEVLAHGVAEEIENQQKLLFTGANADKKISTNVIPVSVRGPSQVDINVVDLPGLISYGDGMDETRELVEKFIASETTLILLVSEAKEDDENVEAIGLVKRIDPSGDRTIRVLTKFDSFDTSKARDKALKLLQRGGSNDLGPHAVICRFEGKGYDAKKERSKLREVSNRSRAGVENLKVRLLKEFGALVQKNLPKLKSEIVSGLNATKDSLDKVGWQEPDRTSMVDILQEKLQTGPDVLTSSITPKFNDFKLKVYEAEKKVTRAWVSKYMDDNVFENPFFRGAKETERCMGSVVKSWWSPYLDEYFTTVVDIVGGLIVKAVSNSNGVSSTLQDFADVKWRSHLKQNIESEFREQCDALLKQEIQFGTCNHDLLLHFGKERVLPDKLIQEIAEASVNILGTTSVTHNKGELDESKSMMINMKNLKAHLLAILEKCRRKWETDFSEKDLFEQQKDRLHAVVKGVYAVEKKTFTDNVLKATRDFVLTKTKKWIGTEIISNKSLYCQNAIDDLEITKKRRELLDQYKKMQQAEEEINRISDGS